LSRFVVEWCSGFTPGLTPMGGGNMEKTSERCVGFVEYSLPSGRPAFVYI